MHRHTIRWEPHPWHPPSQLDSGELNLMWDPFNLTMSTVSAVTLHLHLAQDAKVQISLWGYKESTIEPELIFIHMLGEGVANKGEIRLDPKSFESYDDGPNARSCRSVFVLLLWVSHDSCRMGMVMVNLTKPVS